MTHHLYPTWQPSCLRGWCVSLLESCPHFGGCYLQASVELRPEDVSLLERCPHFRGCYVQTSMELGPEDVSLLEKCLRFRGCYAQASMELGPEVCLYYRGVLISESVIYTGFSGVGTLKMCPYYRDVILSTYLITHDWLCY